MAPPSGGYPAWSMSVPLLPSRRRSAISLWWIAGLAAFSTLSFTLILPISPSLHWPPHYLDNTSTKPTYVTPTTEALTVTEIHDMVSSTNGFFARDYNLELGWNNMRYILEAAFLQAQLLGRTLILPSFVYARSCEYENLVCADYVPMVNRGDAVNSTEWRDLPIDQQMAWRIPIELMLNITHLRQAHPVITTADYLRLHGQSAAAEASNGKWSRDIYHVQPNVVSGKFPSLFTIKNELFDPTDIIRVDEVHGDESSRTNFSVADPLVVQTLYAALPPSGHQLLDWSTAQTILDIWSDQELERVVGENGWDVVYTYSLVLNLDYNKAVATPIKRIAPRSTLRGFKNEFGHLRTNIVHLQGAVHYGRKSGSMYFGSRAAQDRYTSNVLYDFRRIDAVRTLAKKIVKYMFELNGDRLWMAAHLRRGDFLRYKWAMETAPKDHIGRVKRHLATGRDILRHLPSLRTYDVPGNLTVDLSLRLHDPPEPADLFYVATDERDPKVLDLFREEGAVMMDDLLTIEDRRTFGKGGEHDYSWALMISDVRALVEQVVLSEAGFFYGHAMSSVPGGIINLRAARGADPRTALIN